MAGQIRPGAGSAETFWSVKRGGADPSKVRSSFRRADIYGDRSTLFVQQMSEVSGYGEIDTNELTIGSQRQG